MPGGFEETRQVMRFLAKEVSPDTFVNVMPQYHPAGLASLHPAIARSLARGDFWEALKIAREEGLRRLGRDWRAPFPLQAAGGR
jgi:putative pyruvate formate lyase activating enzyme